MSASPARGRRREGGLGALRRLLEPGSAPAPGERCELCATPLGEEHSHLADVEARGLLCACRACWLLFTQEGAARGRYKAIPEGVRRLDAAAIEEPSWEELRIPVRLAFFFRSSPLGRVVAFYPSPAGATESELPLEAWAALVRRSPVLETLAPDVEALLVRGRKDGQGFESYLVPIDACYELTGRVRRRWKGFDGGEEAWNDVDAFFARLAERSRDAGEAG